MPTKSTFFALLSVKLLVSKCSFCGFQFEKNKNRKQKPFLQGGWEERIVCARAHPECVEKAQRPLAFGLACSHTGNRCRAKIAMMYHLPTVVGGGGGGRYEESHSRTVNPVQTTTVIAL